MNRSYPHGVAMKKGARDKVRGGTPAVTSYYVSAKIYHDSYKTLDRDHDGIMCEKL